MATITGIDIPSPIFHQDPPPKHREVSTKPLPKIVAHALTLMLFTYEYLKFNIHFFMSRYGDKKMHVMYVLGILVREEYYKDGSLRLDIRLPCRLKVSTT